MKALNVETVYVKQIELKWLNKHVKGMAMQKSVTYTKWTVQSL